MVYYPIGGNKHELDGLMPSPRHVILNALPIRHYYGPFQRIHQKSLHHPYIHKREQIHLDSFEVYLHKSIL